MRMGIWMELWDGEYGMGVCRADADGGGREDASVAAGGTEVWIRMACVRVHMRVPAAHRPICRCLCATLKTSQSRRTDEGRPADDMI